MFNQNIFTAAIDENGNIFDFIGGRKNQKIGIDIQREQELLNDNNDLREIVENYYNKLIELGAIVPPKSTEEIASEQIQIITKKLDEQTKINESLVETLQTINLQIKELKENGNNGHDNKQSGANSRKKSATIATSD